MRVVAWCADINITNFSRDLSLSVLVLLTLINPCAFFRWAHHKKKKLLERTIPSHAVTIAVAVDADTVVTGYQRFAALIPLGVMIEVGVYTQTVTVLIFITTKLTRESFKRTMNITDM